MQATYPKGCREKQNRAASCGGRRHKHAANSTVEVHLIFVRVLTSLEELCAQPKRDIREKIVRVMPSQLETRFWGHITWR